MRYQIVEKMAEAMYVAKGFAAMTGRQWSAATQGDKHEFRALASAAYDAVFGAVS